ncbi:ATP-binding protein [Roseovarius sp. ZX-A-9]|uniref:ATP-binding protein n=1 Tax=Roseovarius sp. ZX-A-9 TaxID=3014783 RepID=UPI0023309861|nr:ATP-binding protein [Roseovarius sp. ZX-A-9]
MTKVRFSTSHAVLIVAGLSWGLVLSSSGAFTASPTLGWATVVTSAVLIVVYSYKLWISEKAKRAAIERSEELEHMRNAVDEHCLISVVDQNRKVTFVNDGFLKATGYTADELLGKDPVSFQIHTIPGQPERISRRLKSGQIWSGEIRLVCKGGAHMWTHTTISPRFDRTGRFMGSTSIRTDITAGKIAVEEREVVSILDKLLDNVFIFEPDTYRFKYMNQAAMRRVGWDRSTYINKTVLDTDPNFDRDKFDHLVAPLMDGTLDVVNVRAELDDGTNEIFVQYIRSDSGPGSLVAIFRNISDKIEVERIKDEFISTVSHELRSPITSIKGALGLLLAGAAEDLPAKAQNLVSIAHRNADRLAIIVNDILDLEKIAAGRMEFDFQPSDLCSLITDAVQINSGFGKRFDVTVRAEGLDEPAYAKIDTNRMLQVLTNLLSNAAKFSRPGGEVVVSLDREEDHYWINVRDFGVGIAKADIDKIFDRFRQADNHSERSGKGTGLGLSIVKVIMEQHGGKVIVTSEPGIGSTFSLRLPVDHAAYAGQTDMAMVG